MMSMSNSQKISALARIVILVICVQRGVTGDKTTSVDVEKIRKKPIGVGLPQTKVDEVSSFPNAQDFFKKYVHPQKPLLIRGGAKISPAFDKWTDEYFLSVDIPADEMIKAERGKKENRSGNAVTLHFKEFLRLYKTSDIYMVNQAPDFLRADLVVPCPLRCPGVTFADTMVWFSSGGTSSVLHTDVFDNLNCVYRGTQQLALIDRKFSKYYHIDQHDGYYSSVDVDSVDYEKYPGLAKVEYYNVSMEGGDCLFIPHLTAQQVRSFGSSLAISIWWHPESAKVVKLQRCDTECGDNLRLSNANFTGLHGRRGIVNLDYFRQLLYSLLHNGHSEIIDELVYKILKQPVIVSSIPDYILSEGGPVLHSALERLDVNNDDSLSLSEIHASKKSNWDGINEIVDYIKAIDEETPNSAHRKKSPRVKKRMIDEL